MENQSSNCWFNAVIQGIYHTPIIRNFFQHHNQPPEPTGDHEKDAAYHELYSLIQVMINVTDESILTFAVILSRTRSLQRTQQKKKEAEQKEMLATLSTQIQCHTKS